MNATNYLESSKKQFLYYKALGEKAMLQLNEAQLFYTINENTNSISVMVNHLYGNMLSRWTDFLTTDGEKEWRNRDTEFEDNAETQDELLKKWNQGWDCLFNALNELTPENLNQLIYIRNEGQTVIEAINRQLCHYSYHVGQIVFYAKQLKTTEWNSLSIPKNKSKNYNEAKFEKEKTIKHFTDDELKNIDKEEGD